MTALAPRPKLVPPWRGATALFGALLLVAACGTSAAPAAPATGSGAPSGGGSGAPAASAPSAPAVAPVKLRVPYVAVSVTQLPAWVAQDAGLFAKQGLDVTLEYIPTGTTLIQNMVAGEADFGIAGSEAPISASLAGADLVILAPTVDRLLFSVYGKSDLVEPSAIRGQRLGITRVGSSTDFAARHWVQSLGLRAGEDVTLVQAGGQPELLTALQAGAIDAGIVSPPVDVQVRRLGFRLVADLGRLEVPFYQSSAIVARKVIDQQPDLVRRFMRAFVEANSVILQDKTVTKQAIAHYSQTTDDEVLEASYISALPAIPRVPLPMRAAIESAIELVALTNPAAQGADPTRFYDPRFVQELEDSGFIRGLYR